MQRKIRFVSHKPRKVAAVWLLNSGFMGVIITWTELVYIDVFLQRLAFNRDQW